jgi:hypothetical protein
MPNGPTAFQETLVPVAVWTVTTRAPIRGVVAISSPRGVTIGAIAIGTRGVLAVAIGTRSVLAVAIEIRPVVIAKEVFP